jgi:hypothetical protein
VIQENIPIYFAETAAHSVSEMDEFGGNSEATRGATSIIESEQELPKSTLSVFIGQEEQDQKGDIELETGHHSLLDDTRSQLCACSYSLQQAQVCLAVKPDSVNNITSSLELVRFQSVTFAHLLFFFLFLLSTRANVKDDLRLYACSSLFHLHLLVLVISFDAEC